MYCQKNIESTNINLTDPIRCESGDRKGSHIFLSSNTIENLLTIHNMSSIKSSSIVVKCEFISTDNTSNYSPIFQFYHLDTAKMRDSYRTDKSQN
jgi:hypothetical protein